MNKCDCVSANAGWIERPTLEARQEPRRGDMWVEQRYQQLV